ncbi:hypothetical protein [Crateriforma conspicua]|uniref:hypothetical protein n=1 Tax=Crateriforma conspicua TaxID=2527996 RepID=UPI0011B3BD1B|nr:hypothetical protein [Crateriforma conspicua]
MNQSQNHIRPEGAFYSLQELMLASRDYQDPHKSPIHSKARETRKPERRGTIRISIDNAQFGCHLGNNKSTKSQA